MVIESDDDFVPGAELDFLLKLSTQMTCGFEVEVRARGRAVRVSKSGDMEPNFMEIAAVIDSYEFMHSTAAHL